MLSWSSFLKLPKIYNFIDQIQYRSALATFMYLRWRPGPKMLRSTVFTSKEDFNESTLSKTFKLYPLKFFVC